MRQSVLARRLDGEPEYGGVHELRRQRTDDDGCVRIVQQVGLDDDGRAGLAVVAQRGDGDDVTAPPSQPSRSASASISSVSRRSAGRRDQRLPPDLATERRRLRVRHPDLDLPHSGGAHALPVGAHLRARALRARSELPGRAADAARHARKVTSYPPATSASVSRVPPPRGATMRSEQNGEGDEPAHCPGNTRGPRPFPRVRARRRRGRA